MIRLTETSLGTKLWFLDYAGRSDSGSLVAKGKESAAIQYGNGGLKVVDPGELFATESEAVHAQLQKVNHELSQLQQKSLAALKRLTELAGAGKPQ